MKRLILFASLILAIIAGKAQTIHWLTFIDTTDKNVGQIDIVGRQVLYSHFINDVNAALAPKGYTTDIQDFYGKRTSPENCKAAVEGLRISNPNDIIVFYYIGHGGRPNTDVDYVKKHPYPQMFLAQNYDEKLIPLEWVYNELSTKGARLSVTIGMCCNVFQNMTIKEGPAFSPNYGASYMSGTKLARIQELFLNQKGSVIATSSSPGQSSGCFTTTSFGTIDAYTTVLCDIFNNYLDSYGETLTWDDLLGSIGSTINKVTDGEQTPFHETHLTAATAPKTTTPNVPTDKQIEETKQKQTPGTTKQQGDADNWVNSLTKSLATLINVNVSEEDRISLERKLNGLFADDAQVKILGQDGDTTIDRESADVFLGRLATSRLLLNVGVVEGSFNSNNKIQTLKVREVYKK
ncbi:MAG: caspase family protein [Prevotellaceae bacterium]|nr:caspase family protein [Prevotellaceae bacterium]